MRLKKRRSSAVAVLTTVAVVTAWPGAWTGASASVPSTAKDESTARSRPAHLVRSIYTHEFGVSRPTGVAWDSERKVFVVTGRRTQAGTPTTSFTASEQGKGRRILDIASDDGTAAFDPRADRVTVLRDGRRFTVAAGETRLARWARATASGALTDVEPAGTTYGPDGTMYVLDASTDDIVSVSPSGTVETTSLQGLDGVELQGLAYQPGTGNLFVADASADTLYAVDQTGDVVGTRNLADSAVANVESMTFAPSGDGTDPASEQSLYIADAGTADLFGSVAEITFTPLSTPISGGYSETPTTINKTATSEWTPPSPDPSGITYIPGQGLLVSDGEVEEMNDGLNDTKKPEAILYEGVNLWVAGTDGTPVAGKTGDTTKFSDEPVGLEFDAGRLLVSDDTSPAVVYEVANAGGDGMFGTADDPAAREILRTGAFGNTDPEGVAFDSKRKEMLVIDGLNLELFRYSATGALVRQIDVESLGMDDPEGIAYDADRDTVVVIDHVGIWELDEFGSVLGRIETTDANIDKPAGITVAPASDGSGGNSFYIVDRGVDNDSNGFENDGVLFEIGADLPGVGDRPPSISAGADQAVDISELAQLNGQATDPENGTLTYAWKKLSGEGTVEFTGGADKLVTTASFGAVGTYTLRLTVKDKVWTVVDDVVVTVYQPGSVRTVEVPLASGTDDAREAGASVATGRAHNRLGQETDGTPLTTGLRFAGVPVPQGGQITGAYIQFQTESHQAGASKLDIRGEAADNALTFDSAVDRSISMRPSTTAKVTGWAPLEWKTVGEAGVNQRTPDLSSILQEIVDRTGWKAGNAAAFVITGTGTRSAESFEGNRAGAPKLVLQYRTDKNTAPTVLAGADASVKLPANASLDGTVTDDGLPEPAKITSLWSKVSGTGTVTFGDAAAVDTTASFTAAGTYVLRLTANDGALSAQDDVTVTVAAADVVTPPPTPGGGGGGGGGGTPTPTPTPTPDPGSETPEDPTVTLQSQLSSVTYASTVSLTGVVADGGFASEGTTVRLFVRRAPEWKLQELGSTTTDAEGLFTIEDRPAVSSRYYATVGDATSAVVTVLVRPRLTAAVTDAMVLAGTRTAIVGQVSPTVRSHVLRLQRWNGKGWATIASKSLARAARARYRFAVVPKASGVTSYRVVSPQQGGRARVVSTGEAGLVVKAYDAVIRRVNPDADVVVVRNSGTVAFSLAGWWLAEARTGARIALPEFVVRPGRAVRIHSRAGASDRRNLFLGTGEMWVDSGVAELRDARLRLADRLRY